MPKKINLNASLHVRPGQNVRRKGGDQKMTRSVFDVFAKVNLQLSFLLKSNSFVLAYLHTAQKNRKKIFKFF